MPDQRKGNDASGTGIAGSPFDDPNYGADNKIFTREQALKARERLLELAARPLGLMVGSRAKVVSTTELIELLNASEAKALSPTEFIELLYASKRTGSDESTAESD